MTNCDRYQEMISAMLDGELSKDERDELAEHVRHCPDCAAVYVAFRSLSENLNGELEEVPAALHETIMADVRREGLRAKNSAATRRRNWHYVLTAAACLVLVVAAGLSLPKLLGGRSAASPAAPAEVEMLEEAVSDDGAMKYTGREAAQDSVSSTGIAPNSIPNLTVEAPAEASEEEPAVEGFIDHRGLIRLDETQAEALEAIMSGEKLSLEGDPERELLLNYFHGGELRSTTVLLRGDTAVYVPEGETDSYRLDASARELLELLGLDE